MALLSTTGLTVIGATKIPPTQSREKSSSDLMISKTVCIMSFTVLPAVESTQSCQKDCSAIATGMTPAARGSLLPAASDYYRSLGHSTAHYCRLKSIRDLGLGDLNCDLSALEQLIAA